MKKIVLASNNQHKVKEIKKILNNVEILTLNEIGFNEEIDEAGTTFIENALIKAQTVSNFLKNNNFSLTDFLKQRKYFVVQFLQDIEKCLYLPP